MKVTWRDQALQDLTNTYLQFGLESVATGEKFLDAVEFTIELLSDNPQAGRCRTFHSQAVADLRSWSLGKFPPYVLFYQVNPHELEILRLLHGARDLPRLV